MMSFAPEDLRVLLVDRDESHRLALSERLKSQDCEVRQAGSMPEMYRALGECAYSAVICDLAPSVDDGQQALQSLIGAPGRPAVILLGDGQDLIDRLLGLELGADDYMARPVNARELAARVKAVRRGRRERRATASGEAGSRRLFAGFEMDLSAEVVRGADGALVPMPRSEFLLLSALVARPGRVVTRARLQALAGGEDWAEGSRAVDLRVSRLRRRLAAGGEVIRTYRGRGYLLVAGVTEA